MSDTWAHIGKAFMEHAPVLVMLDEYGGDLTPGDENLHAVRASEGSDGIVLYGTREELAAFGRRLVERYS